MLEIKYAPAVNMLNPTAVVEMMANESSTITGSLIPTLQIISFTSDFLIRLVEKVNKKFS